MNQIKKLLNGCRNNNRHCQEKLYYQFYPALFALCKKFFAHDHEVQTPNKMQAIGTHFIPELWAVTRIGKRSELTISVAPFNLHGLPRQSQRTIASQMTGDSLIGNKVIEVINTTTIATGLYYGYSLEKNWIVGTGAAINIPTKGLATTYKYSSPPRTRTDSVFTIRKTSPEWSVISPTFLTGQLHLSYRTGTLNIGAAIIAPGTSLLTEKSVRPVHAQIFIKWNWLYQSVNSYGK